jgi:autotransporter translocation and assembly factor TamB
VPSRGTIRVTRDGYQPHVQDFQLIDHLTQNFQLMLSGTRLDLAGPYTLAIDAACATSTPVAVDLRHRSYAATLTQSGATLEVLLTEPRFRINSAGRGNRFSGRVDAAGATFNLEDFSEQDYDFGVTDPATYANVVESLPSGTFLIVTGTVLTREASGALSGNLQGFFSTFDSRFPNIALLSSATGTCYSSAHRLTLTRR